MAGVAASPRLVYALVALSGASGLMYEVLWIRALGLHFGTSTPAVAMVAATFMGGLALGNAWLGARADRMARPFAAYLRIEIGIAISGLVVSLLLLRGGRLLDVLARAAEHAGSLSFAARWAVIVLLLLAPTILMGGTLPILARALVRRGTAARAVGGLYACNTFGAVAGALLPDFLLVPRLGLSATALIAATFNVMVASGVAWLAAHERPRLQHAALPDDDDRGDRAPARAFVAPPAEQRTALALAALSGFCGMALEVLWSRTLEHWTAALVTSLSVLLAVYLSALAAGAALMRSSAERSTRPARAAGLLLAASGTSALLALAFAPGWRDLQRALWPRPPELARMGLLHEAVDALMHALYLEAVPCLLMGAAFPLVARALVRVGASGASSGRLLTVNTLGCVLGPLVAAFVWLPSAGQQNSYFAVALLLALAGAATAVPWRGAGAPALAVANLACVVGLVAWLPSEHLWRTYFRSGGHVLAVREGATTTAAAAVRYAFGERLHMELLTPGVSMSSTHLGARRYMGMFAHAGLLAARTPERALLICYGVGNTARSLLSHPDLKRLDVVDISSEVLALAPAFAPAHGSNPLADPRVRVFRGDGRHHLIVRDERYDLITSEPPPPNHAGVVNLYSREFYRQARSRLRPGGVVTQWLPMFQLSVADARAMVAAFVAELPHAALLYGHEEHFILIGSNAPLAIDPERAQRLGQLPGVRRELMHSGIGGVADVYGAVVLGGSELRAFARGAQPVADDRPSIQYPWQPLAAHGSYRALFGRYDPARSLGLLPAPASAELREQVARAGRATAHALGEVHRLPAPPSIATELRQGHAIYLAHRERPGDEGLLELIGVDRDIAEAAAAALQRTGATNLLGMSAAAARAARAAQPHDALRSAALTLARRALYLDRPDEALHWLHLGARAAEDRAYHDFLMASALRASRQSAQAAVLYDQAAAATADRRLRAELSALARTADDPALAASGPFASP